MHAQPDGADGAAAGQGGIGDVNARGAAHAIPLGAGDGGHGAVVPTMTGGRDGDDRGQFVFSAETDEHGLGGGS